MEQSSTTSQGDQLKKLEQAAHVGTDGRYIPGEQERLMQEQQQRLAVAGLMVSHQFCLCKQTKTQKIKKQLVTTQGLTISLSQEYCNQVMPGFDQNERYLLEQRER